MRRRVLLPTTIAEAMLDRFQLIDKRERIRPMNMEIHRIRALLVLFATAIVAAVLVALVNANPAWTADRSFEPAPNNPVPVGSTPTTVTNADFNADGKMDLAAQNFSSNSVSVRLGSGDGTFQAKPDVAVGSGPTSVISADFNSDGIADLAVANQNSGNVSILLGQDSNSDGKGDGTFLPKKDYAVGPRPSSVISADFNTDGITDLALATRATSEESNAGKSDQVSVLLGHDSNGDGKGDDFRTAQRFSIAADCISVPCLVLPMALPNQIIAADFNGDNKADLATANVGLRDPIFGAFNNPGGVSVLLGKGDGTFQAPKEVMKEIPDEVWSITAANLDAGSSMDLVATKFNSNVVSVLKGNGDGTFQAPQSLGVGLNPSAVTSADLDGDTKVDDLAVSNYGSNNVSVLFNNDSGGFQAARDFPAGTGPAFVIGADFNTDNFADLAVANQNSNNVSVLLNTESQPPPPETTITKGPSGTVNSTSATFEFSSSEPGSTFQCALDVDAPSAYSPCTSPKTVPEVGQNLAEGWHTFYVKATGSGGTDTTPDMRSWKVDITEPAAPVISSPPEGGRVGSSFTVSGTAEPDSTVQLSEGTASKGSATASSTGNWSILLSGMTEGSHTYKAKATDTAGNPSAESNSRTVTVDISSPTVVSTTPPNQATSVARGISPTATFSEKLKARTINGTTFKLFKVNPDKSTTQITDVVVSISSDGLTAKLNPFGTATTVLAPNTKYKAVVTTGAKDLAGNSLAQQKSWTFTTKP